jgi:hypothetical protein
MTLILVFVIFFVGGPLIFRALMQADPTALTLRVLGLVTAACALGGVVLRYGSSPSLGDDLILTGAAILTAWFAWIGILAFGAQMLRRADDGAQIRRWTAVLGALGTTVPWFGLASADMVGF